MIVHCMMCIGDAVMLFGGMLTDTLVCFCILICIYVTFAGLLCLIGCEGLLWPIGVGVRLVRLNLFSRGHLAVNEDRMGFSGESSACLSSHLIHFVTANIS